MIAVAQRKKKKDILLNHKAERGLKGSLVNPSYPPFPPSKSLARKSVSRVVSTYPQNPLTGTIHLYSCEHSHTLCLPLDIKISSFLPPPFSRLSAHPTSVPTTFSLMSQATPPPACYLPHSLLPFNTSIRMKLQTACSVPIHSFYPRRSFTTSLAQRASLWCCQLPESRNSSLFISVA